MVIRQPCVQGTCFNNRPYLYGESRYISTSEWCYVTLGFRLMRRAHNG